MKNEWYSRNCDNLYKHQHICSKPVSSCFSGAPGMSLLRGIAGGQDQDAPRQEDRPLIAIMAATTTRRVTNPHVQKIALFTLLLPSLIRSLDCGFRYTYVMGYDVGDPFYDSKAVGGSLLYSLYALCDVPI
jgi:hypothetical protein